MINRKQEVVQRILLAAVKVFDKYGLQKTTMRDIAESAGMSKSSLYYYFKSKKDILASVVKRESAMMTQKLSEAVQRETSPQKKLYAYVTTRIHLLYKLTVYYSSLSNAYIDHYDFIEEEREAFTGFEIDSVSEIIKDGISSGIFQKRNVKATAKAIIIIIKALELRLFLSKSKDELESTIETMLGILFQGLEKR